MAEKERHDPQVDAWRLAYRELQADASPDCPDDDRLADLAAGALHEDERSALADHVVSCRSCSGRYRNLARLHAVAGPELMPGERRQDPAPGVLGLGRHWRGIAALLVLGAAVTLAVRQIDRAPGPPAPGVRGAAQPAAPVAPIDGLALGAAPGELSWLPAEGAESYHVVLYDHEASPVWESAETSATSVELPAEVRAGLAAGSTYYWRVFYVAGLERLESDLHRFTLEP